MRSASVCTSLIEDTTMPMILLGNHAHGKFQQCEVYCIEESPKQEQEHEHEQEQKTQHLQPRKPPPPLPPNHHSNTTPFSLQAPTPPAPQT